MESSSLLYFPTRGCDRLLRSIFINKVSMFRRLRWRCIGRRQRALLHRTLCFCLMANVGRARKAPNAQVCAMQACPRPLAVASDLCSCCSGSGRLWPKFGYWNGGELSGFVKRCSSPESRCAGWVNGTVRCTQGYTAEYCSKCDARFATPWRYVARANRSALLRLDAQSTLQVLPYEWLLPSVHRK
jgi:hypothetical protein